MLLTLQTNLCELLGIKHPMIQAGMAGSTPASLAANVSASGALGTLGAAYMQPDEIRKCVQEIKQRTNRPFAVNLFCTVMTDDLTRIEEVQPFLDRFRGELGINNGALDVQTQDVFDEQFQVLLEECVPIISTAFGILPPDKMHVAKQQGIKIISMATTVEEAIIAEKAGADVIVAQGSDAGGHRGTFDMSIHPNGANIGTFSLVPQVVEAVRIPVVAAGGVMNGRGLVAALALGAQGVQMGTAFLVSQESGANRAYKEALWRSSEESTVITKCFSGRPARGIRNTFIQTFEAEGIDPLAFPTQNSATKDIRKAAAEQQNADYMSLWAGQGTRLLRAEEPAAKMVMQVLEEAEDILSNR